MKKMPWKEVRRELGDLRPGGEPREAAAFWADFKARARLHPQHEPARPAWGWPMPRWALAAACALVLVCGAGVYMGTPVQAAELSTINSVEIVASHGGVLIMDDEASQSTILWIVDMDCDGDAGEEAI
jgi:hypothetical protein